MKEFSEVTRQENLKKFQNQIFDVLIIGGGITGAGAARDAASRGMKVALVEKNDFASGTSSRSSKLIHGGIRYLENKDFHLVYEALSERSKLFKMAPHLVHPLKFLIPIYKNSRVGMGLMGLGMWLYDLLALFRTPEIHKKLSVENLVENYPILNSKDLLGGFSYSDAYMDDDRLVVETLRSANEFGATIANYVEVLMVHEDFVEVKDRLSEKVIKIKAQHYISAVGPWTDQLGTRIFPKWKPWLRPTKGIHLTFDRSRVSLPSAVVMATAKDNRIVFAIPRHEMVIIGTTDTDYKGHLENIQAEPEEVEYLLSITNQYFPGAKLEKKDILATYAGVRPLVHDGASSEGKTSREHLIKTYSVGKSKHMTFVAGGKYTTYRLMAEQVVEEALRSFLIEKRIDFLRNNTAAPLNPLVTCENYPIKKDQLQSWSKRFSISISELDRLAQRYGLETLDLLESAPAEMSLIQKEAYFCAQKTMCLFKEDFLRLRTPLRLANPQLAEKVNLGNVFTKHVEQSNKGLANKE